MSRRLTHTLILVPILYAAASCAATDTFEKDLLARMKVQHEAELSAFADARGEFEGKYPMPQALDFGNEGTVILNRCELVGRLGKEMLKVRYTFVNTSGLPMREAIVSLTARDPATGAEQAEEMTLRFPHALKLTPNSTYSTWFELPTHGIHLTQDWVWEVGLEAVRPETGPAGYRRRG
ncbi:MAG: hypothetical protein GY711_21500 [bacterium]|nr:hypothetical protein [bacterium]